jgi:hypothetical protein
MDYSQKSISHLGKAAEQKRPDLAEIQGRLVIISSGQGDNQVKPIKTGI